MGKSYGRFIIDRGCRVNDAEVSGVRGLTGLAEQKQTRRAIQLEGLSVPAGKSAAFFVLYSAGTTISLEPAALAQALVSRGRAVAYWEKAALPYDRVQVPDAGIQALVDSSIRNIWQAREIKAGLPAFQVGPTCYRGLWIVDGAFLLDAAAMVGAGQDARNGVAYELTFQKPDEVWQQEYDDFMSAFRHAAKRDMGKDPHGNAYLPTLMGEAGTSQLPQRAQWAFCHAVYPGQLFAKDDPLVAGNLAMLAATEREGMVFGTGWDASGIWNYFASFYAHAWLWQGEGGKAADALYAFANHAAPVLVWREEQALKGAPFKKVGDMPHNWASAEFIRLTVHLLALERGDEMHLLEGYPRAWAGPGMLTRLNGVATRFGPLDLTVQAATDGHSATLEVKALAANCKAIIVHLPDGSTKRMAAQQGGTLHFPLATLPQAQ